MKKLLVGLLSGILMIPLGCPIEATDDAETQPLVITPTEVSTEGTFTLYDVNGDIVQQYEGDYFDIINDGTDGKPIIVEVHLPYENTCSCFQ